MSHARDGAGYGIPLPLQEDMSLIRWLDITCQVANEHQAAPSVKKWMWTLIRKESMAHMKSVIYISRLGSIVECLINLDQLINVPRCSEMDHVVAEHSSHAPQMLRVHPACSPDSHTSHLLCLIIPKSVILVFSFYSIWKFIIDVWQSVLFISSLFECLMWSRVLLEKLQGTGINWHQWQVAQATSLMNIVFQMSNASNTTHQGIWMENGRYVHMQVTLTSG